MRLASLATRLAARLVAMALILVTCLVACAGDEEGASDHPAALSGQPVRLMVQVPLTGQSTRNPEPPVGAKAAARAINAAGGIKGRPLEVQVCDDQFDPGKSAGCARLAVGAGVVAYVGAHTGQGDRYMPVLEKAGIPSVGNIPASASESTSPLSYPIGSGAAVSLAGVGALMGKLGCRKIAVAYTNTAGPTFVVDSYLQRGLDLFGVRIAQRVPIPVTAGDLSAYAGPITSVGADCATVVAGATVREELTLALRGKAADLTLVFPASDLGPTQLARLGPAAEGIYLVGSAAPAADRGNAGARSFNQEVDAFGDRTTNRNEAMMNAWAATHIVANLLARADTIDAAGLVAQIKAAKPIGYAPIVPFDWRKPTKLLPGVRTFSNQLYVAQVRRGAPATLFFGRPVDITRLPAAP
jgi:ABC-type branched-subunit amino acid transport system substrate-binding protein